MNVTVSGVVDRIWEDGYATVVFDNEDETDFTLKNLPSNLKEGDTLKMVISVTPISKRNRMMDEVVGGLQHSDHVEYSRIEK